ncbi:hypothetical protein CASFOL_012118 [Castilleja foliolosa]|uniref:Uncharacterized protein n=1 Tax=Castilleja foliolosa TaxID=1961234 RepID=A0ABD3DTL0_9LAMI
MVEGWITSSIGGEFLLAARRGDARQSRLECGEAKGRFERQLAVAWQLTAVTRPGASAPAQLQSPVSCFCEFKNLEKLELGFNNLTSLEGLKSCLNLKWLSVVQNKLQSLKGIEG